MKLFRYLHPSIPALNSTIEAETPERAIQMAKDRAYSGFKLELDSEGNPVEVEHPNPKQKEFKPHNGSFQRIQRGKMRPYESKD